MLTTTSNSGSDLDSDSDFEMDPLVSDSDADDELEPFVVPGDEEKRRLEETTPIDIPLTLRQRRQSKSDPRAPDHAFLKRRGSITKPATKAIPRVKSAHIIHHEEYDDEIEKVKLGPRELWKKAMHMLRKRSDPWKDYHIEKKPTHAVIRHRYNALKKMWIKDECYIKMEELPFNHGAMRECFRMKKVMKRNANWLKAQNYVAKCYIQQVDRSIYFEDVVLQMDAKLWGEEFNRHRPPKKVDIFQMAIIEFKNLDGAPLYHLEHYIEGEYIKYNSNSGFVEDNMRLTPQAFSHFTFERSGHELIVIDIQGVGDLYTDPQIHTADGQGYGDGNLGTRGMALFFHSHVCNKICTTLNLAPFDLADSEKETRGVYLHMFEAATKLRGQEEMCISPSPRERIDLSRFLHKRSISTSSRGSGGDSGNGDAMTNSDHDDEESDFQEDDEFQEAPIMFRPRRTFVSESENDTLNKDEERNAFTLAMQKNHRSSCMMAELNKINLRRLTNQFSDAKDNESENILGQVHLDLAKYHEAGRFTMSECDIDHEATYFHVEHAARLGILDAILTMARLYLGLPRDVLCEVNREDYKLGIEFMEMACDAGNREAAVLLAQAFEKGQFGLTKDCAQAVHFYEMAIELTKESCLSSLEQPRYILRAAMAAMFVEGDPGLDANPQKAYDLYQEAAEEAQSAMKGRLAMKYYTMAEEAAAYIDD